MSVYIPVSVQAVAQEIRCAVRDETVALHFTHTQTAFSGTALHGLTCKHGHGTAGACVDLVVDQVLKALIECRTQENERVERASSVAIVKT